MSSSTSPKMDLLLLAPKLDVLRKDYYPCKIDEAISLLEGKYKLSKKNEIWGNGTIAEIIEDGFPVHFYGDIDYKAKTREELEKFDLNIERNIICDKLNIKPDDIIMCFKPIRHIEKDNSYKVGAHFVVPNTRMKSRKDARNMLDVMNFPSQFDRQAYNEKFICVLQGKGDGVVFQKAPQPDGSIPNTKDYFVTYMTGNEIELIVPEKAKEEKKETPKTNENTEANIDEIKCLLKCINAGSKRPRNDWISVLSTIKQLLGDSDEAYDIADEWSMTGDNYDPRGFPRDWRSIKENNYTIATLVKFAKEDNIEKFTKDYLPIYGKKVKPNEIDMYKCRKYAWIKEEFEKRVFKIVNPPMFYQMRLDGGYSVATKTNIETAYQELKFESVDKNGVPCTKSFIKKWLNDENKRMYEMEEFDPSMKVGGNVFNTFTGFAPESLPSAPEDTSIDLIIEHLKNLFKNDYEYILKWMANIIQNPTRKAGVALILQSDKQGVGKSVLFEWFGQKVLGSKYYTTTSDPVRDLFSKHSSAVDNRLLVIMEEVKSDIKPHMDKLKQLITGNRTTIEPKGIMAYEIANHASFVIISNNDNVVFIENSDRRYVGFNCDHNKVRDETYFNALIKQMDDPNVVRKFYDYLKSYKIDFNNFQENRPITDFYKDNQRVNIPTYYKFISHECEARHFNTISAADLYSRYIDFCHRNYPSHKDNIVISSTMFGLKLKKIEGMSRIRSNGSKYQFDWEDVKEYLIKNKLYDDEVF